MNLAKNMIGIVLRGMGIHFLNRAREDEKPTPRVWFERMNLGVLIFDYDWWTGCLHEPSKDRQEADPYVSADEREAEFVG